MQALRLQLPPQPAHFMLEIRELSQISQDRGAVQSLAEHIGDRLIRATFKQPGAVELEEYGKAGGFF